jgi:hypothetical protein
MSIILVVGTGQLGSRYIQGLATCSSFLEIWNLDPSLTSLNIAKERWESVGGSSSIHRINWTQDYSEIPNIIDLAIVATNADVRSHVLKVILRNCSIRYLVLEKVLVQSSYQLEELLHTVQSVDGAWVNTSRRMNTWHKKLQNIITDRNPIKVYVGNNDWGLACNSIHFLDLVSWWSNEKLITIDTSALNKTWIASKRPRFFEINGILKAIFSSGSELTLESRKEGETLLIKANNLEGEWTIDEMNGIAKGPKGDTILGKTEHQSKMTSRLVESILETGCCDLPNFEESAHTHNIFLQSMLEHWNQTKNRNDTIIPIT